MASLFPRSSRFLSCFLLLLAVFNSHFLWSSESRKSLSLDSGPLKRSLNLLSQQFSIPIVYKPDVVNELRAPSINGSYNLSEALDILLRDFSLKIVLLPQGVLLEKDQLSPPEDFEILDDYVIEEVSVEGFRGALRSAQEIKRDSLQIRDSILADDIARFPDLNLAESLQRIPSTAISREAGEGRRVSLRGLSPEFTLVQINGMDVLGNTDSPMDSRGQKSRDRAFDFNLFPSELFSEITVQKTRSARHQEGGVAGLVSLEIPEPFARPGYHGLVNVQMGVNEYTESLSPRLSALVSNTGDHWGGLFSIAYSERETEEQGANTIRWRYQPTSGADVSALDDDLSQAWNSGEIRVPRGNRYSIWQSDQQRIGVGGSLQYLADRFDWNTNLLFSRLDNERDEFHLYPRGLSTTPIISSGGASQRPTRVNAIELRGDQLIYADYSNAQMATESRVQHAVTDFYQISSKVSWDVSDTAVVNGQVGWARSEFSMPQSDKVYTEGVSDVSIDYRRDHFYGDYRYSVNLEDPNNWYFHEIDVEEYYAESGYVTGQIDLEVQIDSVWRLQSGVAHKRLKNRTARQNIHNLLRDSWALSRGEIDDTSVIPVDSNLFSGSYRVLSDHHRESWLVLDVDRVLDYFDINADRIFGESGREPFSISDSRDQITEESSALYVQLDWATDLFGREILGDFGLRYFYTETTSNNFIVNNFQEVENSYQGALPSFNASYKFSDGWQLRGSYSKDITRPDLVLMSQPLMVYGDSQNARIIAPNPDLKPYQSTNYDMALEYYFEEEGFFSIGTFYKRISDYIVTESRSIRGSDINDFDSVVMNPEVSSITLVAPENSEVTRLKGIEFALQKEFDFLPPPFSSLGAIVNFTYNQGRLSYYGNQTGQFLFRKTIPNLSKRTRGITLYYEKDTWGFRLSSNYRSRFISQVDTSALADEDERGFHESTYYDFSGYVRLSDQWRVTIEGVNVTDEREVQYSDSANLPYNTTSSGATYFFGMEYNWGKH